ncbi:MAG TPA: Crp/Fnr family transcriptional regulator [Puia sp.]|nr:Crp/Fnr family transcriptional regulator [Puia sp.]
MAQHAFSFITDSGLLEEIEKLGVYHTFQPGDIIIPPEKYIRCIPLIIKGTIRVSRVDSEGNELFLYYISTGQSCAVSFGACLTDKVSCIKAVAEEEIELISIPVKIAREWFRQFENWRTYVAMTLGDRFDELIKAIDSIAFKRTDERLINFLSARSKALNSNTIHITHREIAGELSTSREVVSRLLKRLEQEKEVRLSRNKIELVSGAMDLGDISHKK